MPTRGGARLAALLLTMLGAGLNYNNSLALLLTFPLAGFALVGMHQCHRRLLGLVLLTAEAQPCFAGEQLELALGLRQPAGAAAAELEASLRQDGREIAAAIAGSAGDIAQVRLRWPAVRRGRWRLDSLSLRTRAPTGLFRAWVWLHLDATAIVYPRPAGDLPLPKAPGELAGEQDLDNGLDELTSLRAFREGDSPRQVAWKAYARGAPLLVKEYRGFSGQEHEFTYAALAGLEREARLSQLCQWVLSAERRGERYALQLPGERIASNTGPQHLHQCLTALALFGLPGEDRP